MPSAVPGLPRVREEDPAPALAPVSSLCVWGQRTGGGPWAPPQHLESCSTLQPLAEKGHGLDMLGQINLYFFLIFFFLTLFHFCQYFLKPLATSVVPM